MTENKNLRSARRSYNAGYERRGTYGVYKKTPNHSDRKTKSWHAALPIKILDVRTGR